jgi:hypothetical protein
VDGRTRKAETAIFASRKVKKATEGLFVTSSKQQARHYSYFCRKIKGLIALMDQFDWRILLTIRFLHSSI